MQAMLVQASKDTIAIQLFTEPYQSQVFVLQAFFLSLFIVNFCLSLESLLELKARSSSLNLVSTPH